jgi:hypothetical protein
MPELTQKPLTKNRDRMLSQRHGLVGSRDPGGAEPLYDRSDEGEGISTIGHREMQPSEFLTYIPKKAPTRSEI